MQELPASPVAPTEPATRESSAARAGSPWPEGAIEDRAAAARRLVRAGGTDGLDRLSELAARLLGASSAQVSLISEVQNVMGSAGGAAGSTGQESPADESLCTVTVRSGAALVITDAARDDRVAALPPVTSGGVASYLGVPLVGSDGYAVGALCVFDTVPRRWSEWEVTILSRLAAPVVAELEMSALNADLEASRVVWEMAADAAQIGAFAWDLTTNVLRWDDRLYELFEVDPRDFGSNIEAFTSLLHPDDKARVELALENAISSCGEYEAEYRIVLPSGELRWIFARGRALAGPDGSAVRLLGAAYDTTAVQEGEARTARVLEAMPTAFFQLDRDWRIRFVNTEAERLMQRGRDTLVGEEIWTVFPEMRGSAFETQFRLAVQTRQPVAFESPAPELPDVWYEVRGWPTPDGLSVYVLDVTSRHRARRQLEVVARRTSLLATLTSELGSTLDAQEAATRLTSLLVPELGDRAVTMLLDDERTGLPAGLLSEVGLEPMAPLTGPAVLRGPALVRLASALGQPAAGWVDPASALVALLHGRERVVGLLAILRGPDRGPITPALLTTVSDVASRAGLALDNARMYAEQRELAEGLQRSLLTEPPPLPGTLVAVRYEPAAQAAQVGGDWYDAFVGAQGDPVVVIGDVVGHDTAAAAAMGQLRSLLRGIAAHGGEGPAAVLTGVDRVLETLLVTSTATAVVARFESPDPGRRVMRWSNAGHPPPALLRADGRVELLDTAEPELLLGFDSALPRTDTVTELAVGDTVLLYTDGLVERRGEGFDAGLDRLRAVLTEPEARGLAPGELCDWLLGRLAVDRREDDVALACVRLS